MAVTVFLDTSVLLAGLVDFGPQSAPAQRMHARRRGENRPAQATAWHCCLEFFSVATRLPPEFRLTDRTVQLLQEEVFARIAVHDLPSADRVKLLKPRAQVGSEGGRIYDAHIAEVARAAGAGVVVTDNRRHFLAASATGSAWKHPPSSSPR